MAARFRAAGEPADLRGPVRDRQPAAGEPSVTREGIFEGWMAALAARSFVRVRIGTNHRRTGIPSSDGPVPVPAAKYEGSALAGRARRGGEGGQLDSAARWTAKPEHQSCHGARHRRGHASGIL